MKKLSTNNTYAWMILVCKNYIIVLYYTCICLLSTRWSKMTFHCFKETKPSQKFKERRHIFWLDTAYVVYCLHWDVAKIVICKLFNLLSRYKLHKILHSFEEKKLTLELTDFKRIATNFKQQAKSFLVCKNLFALDKHNFKLLHLMNCLEKTSIIKIYSALWILGLEIPIFIFIFKQTLFNTDFLSLIKTWQNPAIQSYERKKLFSQKKHLLFTVQIHVCKKLLLNWPHPTVSFFVLQFKWTVMSKLCHQKCFIQKY